MTGQLAHAQAATPTAMAPQASAPKHGEHAESRVGARPSGSMGRQADGVRRNARRPSSVPISPLPTGGRSAASVASSLEQASDALAVAGRPLDPETRAWSERLLNADLGSVSVHDGPRATAAADALGARAFTVGDAVVFGGDVGDAGTQEGRRTLLHELVHVVQGGGARAQRPVSVLPPSSPAESEASDLSGRSLASAVEVSAVGPVRHARTGAAETVACQ